VVPAIFPPNLNNNNTMSQTGFSGERLVRFEPATLVPFEPKLIDMRQLNRDQADWLDSYNRRIYEAVGLAFKRAGNDRAFQWVEARTRPVRSYTNSMENP
jgi:C-terminal region of peptidase_M24